MLLNSCNDYSFQMLRCNILDTDLDNAWSFGISKGQQHAEIQIVSKDDRLILSCPVHNNSICGSRITDRRPVHGRPAMMFEDLFPLW